MGLPKNMDGTEGPRAQSARSLAQNILQRRDIPLALWDERLSSAGVERALLEADASRARRDEVIDYVARSVQPELATIEGVGEAKVFSRQGYAMRVWLDPDRMAAHAVTAADVNTAIRCRSQFPGKEAAGLI